MERRALFARIGALALWVSAMTVSAVAAHPVTLRITNAPETAWIGGPLNVGLALRNGGSGAFEAPDAAEAFRLRLTAEDGRIVEMAADQRMREVSGAPSPPDEITALQEGDTLDYRMDAARMLLAQPAAGRYSLTAHYYSQGVAFESPPVTVTFVAAPVTAAAWFRDGAAETAVGLASLDAGGARSLSIVRMPQGRPDLFAFEPLAQGMDAAHLSLPASVWMQPALALALTGGVAQVVHLDGGGVGARLDTGLTDAVALGGLEQAGAAVWILADLAAPGALVRLTAAADGTLSAAPLPPAGPLAVVAALTDGADATLMVIDVQEGAATIRTPEAAASSPLPLPAGRIVSLGAPRIMERDMAYVDAVIETADGALVLARAPLSGPATGPATPLPRMRAQIERWIWPDLASPALQVVAVARGSAALIVASGGAAQIGKRVRVIAPDGAGAALLALNERGLWLAQTSRDEGLRIERVDLP